jgi:hypothetical protein
MFGQTDFLSPLRIAGIAHFIDQLIDEIQAKTSLASLVKGR